MRKIISLATIVVMLLTVSFMPTYATVNDIEEIEKENYIENHINDLLNGDVEPVKEDFNGNVSIALSEVEKADPLVSTASITASSTSTEEETKLVEQNSELDVILLDEEKNEYLATIIVDNKYETNATGPVTSHDDTKNKTDCDVKLSYSAHYEIITVGGAERVKVIKYIGKYVQNNDSQMTCSKLRFTSKAQGLVFNSAGTYIGTGITTPDKTVNSPTKGAANTYITNQQGYVEVPPGNNAGRLHYTLKRTVSSYTTTGYMAFDWGDYYT